MDVRLLYFDDCPNWRLAEARLDEVTQHFLHEQRIAFGLTMNGRRARTRNILPADRIEHAVDFVDAEPTKRNSQEAVGPPQLG